MNFKQMNFQQFLVIFKARYKAVLFVLLGTVTVVLIASLFLENKYIASTSLVLDVKTPDPLMGAIVMSGMAMPSYMATQTEIISSERVAQSAVKLLKLDENRQVKEQWFSATEGKGQLTAWLGNLLLKKLDVKPSRDSNVINLSFTAADPVFAATVANAFAQAYIDTNLELKVEPARQYTQWFQARVVGLRAELEKAQARLAAFQKKTGMVANGSKMQSLENSKISELSGQLVLAETQSADMQSKRRHAGDTLAEVMQNPVVLGLKADINRLEGKLQESSRNLGKNHPQYQAMESEIASLKQKLDAETKQILSSINTADNVSTQKQSALRATIETHKRQAIGDSTKQDQIAVLENDVESAQKAYDIVVQRYTESNLQSQASQTNISILTPATEPTEKSSPRLFMNMLVATFVGAMLGVLVALVMEMFNPKVRTADALEEATGLGVLTEFKQQAEPIKFKKKLLELVSIAMSKLRFKKALMPA
jgi:polysaccharide biosynthesis transport protein